VRGCMVEKQMSGREEPREGAGFYLVGVVLVQGAPRRSWLGERGGISGAALCTGSRGEVDGRNGWVVWSERSWFQNVNT
jgi:hypothetical protein